MYLDTTHETPQHDEVPHEEEGVGQESDVAEASPAAESNAAASDLEALTKERDELKDKLLRAHAEMENIQRRATREVQDMAKFAIRGFASDLLSASDNLRRALDAVDVDSEDAQALLKSLVEGVEMTEKDLLQAFEKHGIEKISPKGEKFDHNFHQAMFEVPTNDMEAGTVVEVMQPGYKLHDRLLRPAMVGVAKKAD